MTEPKWLRARMVRAIHDEALATFGGAPSIRSFDLLESALARPRHVFAYGADPSLFDLAAAYCSGIVRNHPFVDGNKRTGLLAAGAFLFLNGYDLEPAEPDEVRMMVGLAAGEITETVVADWLARNASPRVG